MGYVTEFSGQVRVYPPLNESEQKFLRAFSETRRMLRVKGPYHVSGGGLYGRDHEEDAIDYNKPHVGQPSLWCGWISSEDGTHIEWNGIEKFYDSAIWMRYIINHFLRPNAQAFGAEEFEDFTFDHICNGVIEAQGENKNDAWRLIVIDNDVKKAYKKASVNPWLS